MNIQLTATFCAGLAMAAAAEKRVSFTSLPAPVQEAATKQLNGAKIRGCSQEEENGKVFYEVETVGATGHRDLLFDGAGALVEAEQEVALTSIPEAAQAELRKEAEGGRIVSVESVKKGAAVNYEAVIEKGGHKREAAVSADGKPMKD